MCPWASKVVGPSAGHAARPSGPACAGPTLAVYQPVCAPGRPPADCLWPARTGWAGCGR